MYYYAENQQLDKKESGSARFHLAYLRKQGTSRSFRLRHQPSPDCCALPSGWARGDGDFFILVVKLISSRIRYLGYESIFLWA